MLFSCIKLDTKFQTDWVDYSNQSSLVIQESCYIDYPVLCQEPCKIYLPAKSTITTRGPKIDIYCEDTGILILHWITYGYFRTVPTSKSTYGYFRNLHTHTTHRSHAHFTRHVHDWQSQFTRPVSTRNLHDTHKIYKYTLRAYNLRSHLHVQSMCPNYVYNLRAQLTRTIYVLVWSAHIIRLSLARTCYALILHVQPTRLTYTICHVIRLSLARTYYTL